MSIDPRNEDLIRAYLVEREAYEHRGLTARVADVDAELKRLGYTRAAKPAVKERAVKSKPETRG